jgi:hypothetical protein
MPNKLSGIQVGEITLCKSPAVPGAKIVIMKSQETPKSGDITWNREVVFKAFNDEKQIAYGYVLVPEEVDSQDDFVSAEDVEKAAHRFLEIMSKGEQEGQGVGYEHKVFTDIGHPVESVVDRDGSVAKSMGVSDEDIRPGGWWAGIRMEDEYWDLAKSGEITGFSIGGLGARESVEKENSGAQGTLDSAMDFIAKLCGGKKRKRRKLRKATSYTELTKSVTYDELVTIVAVRDAIIEKSWYLVDAIWSIIDDEEVVNKVAKVKESVGQFLDDISALEKVEKQVNKSNLGDVEMTEEQIEKLTGSITKIEETLTKVDERLGKLEKTEAPPDDKPPGDTDPPATDPPITKAKEDKEKPEETEDLTKKVDELTKKLDEVAKAVNPRAGDDGNGQDEDGKPVHKSIKEGGAAGTPWSFQIPARG